MSSQRQADPRVPELDYSAATATQCIEALARYGAIILRNVLDKGVLEQIKRDVDPAFSRDVPYSKSYAFPKETRRANGLIGKSTAFTQQIVGNQLYQAVCNGLLTCSHEMIWGDQKRTTTVKPVLDATTCFSIGPGATNQPLHRDDSLHHNVLTQITAQEYTPGRDELIGFFIAGTNTTKANGATRVIPQSHLWGMNTMPHEADAIHVELCAGDGLIMLGSCFHGGSANTTKKEYRMVFAAFMTKGINRTEENQFLANSIEDFNKYGKEIQNIAGFRMGSLGWVDFRDPKHLLTNDASLYPPGYDEEQ